jgi:hypothetical protein
MPQEASPPLERIECLPEGAAKRGPPLAQEPEAEEEEQPDELPAARQESTEQIPMWC